MGSLRLVTEFAGPRGCARELWFAKIERDLLARGVFTSVADLARKIRRYIRHYNQTAKPVRWSYRNPAHRISSTSASTVH